MSSRKPPRICTGAATTKTCACGASRATRPSPNRASSPVGLEDLFRSAGDLEPAHRAAARQHAEGAVDQDFRRFINNKWRNGDETAARKVFETDGFTCKDGNRPEATAVPLLECERVYSIEDNVHSWTVRFWPNQERTEAHYVRLHMRDPMKNYDEKKTKNH